jgi:hypothetical protein
MRKYLLWIGLFSAFVAFAQSRENIGQHSGADSPQTPVEIKLALNSITDDGLLKHIKVLASDEYEGRAPGTDGETLTVAYLIEQFKRAGLKPGNPNNTYLQKVPLVGFTSRPSFSLSVRGKQTAFSFPEDYVARSRRFYAFVFLVFLPKLLWRRETIIVQFDFDIVASCGFVMELKTIAVAAKDKRNIEDA